MTDANTTHVEKNNSYILSRYKRKLYSISSLSKEFDVTTRTIRFYEDAGLLTPVRQGRNRLYTVRDRTRLKLILRGKRLGFSLNEIGEMFRLYDSEPGEVGQLNHILDKIAEKCACWKDNWKISGSSCRNYRNSDRNASNDWDRRPGTESGRYRFRTPLVVCAILLPCRCKYLLSIMLPWKTGRR